jgi:hypothetical protein
MSVKSAIASKNAETTSGEIRAVAVPPTDGASGTV